MQSNYSYKTAGISQSERDVLDTMTKLGKLVIQAEDLEQQFGYTRKNANLILSRLTRKNWLQRLKAGRYRIIPLGSDNTNPTPEDAWAIAMELFSPCYISGWTTAEHWELTEQVFNSTVIFTTQKQRQKEVFVSGLIYITKFIDEHTIFGVQKIWSSNKPILIADLHRTIIDILDDPQIGGGGRHMIDIMKNYLQNKNANIDTLWQYAEKLNHGALYKRLGFIAEKFINPLPLWIDQAHSRIKSGIIKLDPHGPNSGPINTKWGIKINIPIEDIS